MSCVITTNRGVNVRLHRTKQVAPRRCTRGTETHVVAPVSLGDRIPLAVYNGLFGCPRLGAGCTWSPASPSYGPCEPSIKLALWFRCASICSQYRLSAVCTTRCKDHEMVGRFGAGCNEVASERLGHNIYATRMSYGLDKRQAAASTSHNGSPIIHPPIHHTEIALLQASVLCRE